VNESRGYRQRAILILGPGRSGTSTLTRALGALGVYLGKDFRRPVRKNPRGNQEEVHLLKLSKAVRNSIGLRADSVRLVDETAFDNPRTRALADQMRQAIERHFGQHPVWTFKYAGSGRILPFWLKLLPELDIEPAFLFAYRNPLSVAPSRARLDRVRGRPEHNQLEWLANVVPCFNQLRGRHVVVVDYDRLLDDPNRQLQRIAAGLGIPVTERIESGIETFSSDFLHAEWRHSSFGDEDLEGDDSLNPLVRRAALLLSRLAGDTADLNDPATWAEWQEIGRLHRDQASTLRLIDQLNTDNRQARWWDLARPLKLVWNKLPLLRTR